MLGQREYAPSHCIARGLAARQQEEAEESMPLILREWALTVTRRDVLGGAPPADQADMIIHAALILGDDLLMASDDPTTEAFGPVQGMMVSYDAADVATAHRVFDALADGGKVTQAVEPTFFSEAFGMCVDRFGTPWMIVGPPVQQPS